MNANLLDLDTLRANPDWASLPLFDRTGWRRVRFGEVVQHVNETEREPVENGIERFIGLEHLEPGSLHVRSWGNVVDGTTFTRRCKAGQVLFGKRRAYQRKVAVAEFDAVVSGDIYVFAPKNGELILDLLPFLCISDRFFEYAVGTSAGSLSPRTNWSSLAKFEFDLPPIDKQRRLAEILWAVDTSLQQWQATEVAISLQRRAIIAKFMGDNVEFFQRLGDFLEEAQYGSSSKCIIQKGDELYPVLRIPNVIGERIDFDDLVWSVPTKDAEKYQLEHGDVLIVRTNGNPDYVGRTAVFEGSVYEQCLFASYLIRLRPSPAKLLPQFLHEMLASDKVKRDIRKQVKSSAGNYNLNTEGIRGLNIPVPPLKIQRELLRELTKLSDGLTATRHHISEGMNLNSSLLNTLFGATTP